MAIQKLDHIRFVTVKNIYGQREEKVKRGGVITVQSRGKKNFFSGKRNPSQISPQTNRFSGEEEL